jgi:hypothetical protein
MTDFHSVVAREIAALGKFARPVDRGALYERARAALVGFLEGATPALDEPQMLRERLSLEEAIRKVEGDAARADRESRARSKTSGVKAPTSPPQREEPAPDSSNPDPLMNSRSQLADDPLGADQRLRSWTPRL